MGWFSASVGENPFEMFSLSHYTVLLIFLIVSGLIYYFKEQFSVEKMRFIEIFIAISLAFFEVAYHFWMYKNGIWKMTDSLPIDLCSISLVLAIILLLFQNKVIYEILLFTALLGASQALVTPALAFEFPHFRFFHFFYTHMMMIWVVLYFTWVKGYRPTFRSIVKVVIFLNVLFPIVMLVNHFVDGNYMFLSEKPRSASLLDWLGPHPWYILSMEGLLIILSLIIWLIFREKKFDR